MPQRKKPRAPADPMVRIVDAALALAARQGWHDTTMADIAAEAGLALAEVHRHARSKGAVLAAFARSIDQAVLASTPRDLGREGARDRLFDVLMRRFDALRPYRDGVRAVARAARCDPLAAAAGACLLLVSMRWMLEAAGIGTGGLAGRLRAKGLAAVYLAVRRVWFADDSEDLAKTMAALDKGLRRAEALQSLLCRGPAPAPRAATA